MFVSALFLCFLILKKTVCTFSNVSVVRFIAGITVAIGHDQLRLFTISIGLAKRVKVDVMGANNLPEFAVSVCPKSGRGGWSEMVFF